MKQLILNMYTRGSTVRQQQFIQ